MLLDKAKLFNTGENTHVYHGQKSNPLSHQIVDDGNVTSKFRTSWKTKSCKCLLAIFICITIVRHSINNQTR